MSTGKSIFLFTKFCRHRDSIISYTDVNTKDLVTFNPEKVHPPQNILIPQNSNSKESTCSKDPVPYEETYQQETSNKQASEGESEIRIYAEKQEEVTPMKLRFETGGRQKIIMSVEDAYVGKGETGGSYADRLRRYKEENENLRQMF